MNMNEIRYMAKERDISAGKMRKTELIRAIQSEEHNEPCFATEHFRECDQMECLWRSDCERNIS